MYICLCRAITDDEIRKAIFNGAQCTKSLKSELGVSMQCGKCEPEVKAILDQTMMDLSLKKEDP